MWANLASRKGVAMLYYTCPDCSRESLFPDDQAGKAIKCPHCGMLGMAYGVNVRREPDPELAEIVIPPPEPAPWSPPELERAPTRPEAPELEPIEPEAPTVSPPGTPERQEVPVRRVEPHMGPTPPLPLHPGSVASLGLGLIALMLSCCVGIGAMFGIAAIVAGTVAMGRMSQQPGVYAAAGRGLAKAGIILGVVALPVSLIAMGMKCVH